MKKLECLLVKSLILEKQSCHLGIVTADTAATMLTSQIVLHINGNFGLDGKALFGI